MNEEVKNLIKVHCKDSDEYQEFLIELLCNTEIAEELQANLKNILTVVIVLTLLTISLIFLAYIVYERGGDYNVYLTSAIVVLIATITFIFKANDILMQSKGYLIKNDILMIRMGLNEYNFPEKLSDISTNSAEEDR